ncbi:glycosyltransferase family 2 protein [Thermodesulfobacteriota bacterium]
MSSIQLLSIVLPVYNQAQHIGSIVQEYDKVLEGLRYRYEMILVVNGSNDDTLSVCRSLESRFSSIRVVCSEKGGWGLAIKLGLAASQGDLLCYTNSARTTPQDLLLILLYAVANRNVVIKANRKIRESWFRRLGSLLYNLECRMLFDLSFWDINGTPKVFPRSFNKLMLLNQNDDLIDMEFNIVCRNEEYPILEVPILSHQRHGGKSTTNIFSAYKLYLGAYKYWRKKVLNRG